MHMTHSFTGSLAMGLILAGCAATPPKGNASLQTEGPPTLAQEAPCTATTGSRIPSVEKGCNSNSRTYDSADISRTGATTAGGALQLLDPAITVSR